MSEYVYEFTKQFSDADLLRIFGQTEWAADRTAAGLQALVENTRVCLGVWHEGRLIGFARAITDDVYRAYIEDVIVDGDYRRRGIAREMMRRMLQRLDHVEEITLDCRDHLLDFYRSLGFERVGLAYLHIWKGGTWQ